jgi:hypothetical protein
MEKTNVVNVQGAKVGERIVCDANDSSEAKVMWNEGSRQFHINAPSLEDALTFEKSKVWMSAGCLDFQSFQPCHPTKPCI